jgi:L-Ala-D/L-Glu epimerase
MIARETIDTVENIFVMLEDDAGFIGLGVASPAQGVTGESVTTCLHALEEHLDAILQGADTRYRNSLLRKLEQELYQTPAARAAVDLALHDLWSLHMGLPLVDVLGRCHESLPTSMTIGIKPVRETVADAREYHGQGFRILKVKIGLDIEEDIERLQALHYVFGDNVLVRVDANQGYSTRDYHDFVKRTAGLNLEFVEQPLPAADMASMSGFPEHIRRKTAADESLLSPGDAIRCLNQPRPFGIFNIKLMKCGGVAPALQIAEIARLAGIEVMWGCMDESIIGISAALHAALASPATRYLDLDGSLELARDLVDGGFILENGCLRTTDRPGLGVTLIKT